MGEEKTKKERAEETIDLEEKAPEKETKKQKKKEKKKTKDDLLLDIQEQLEEMKEKYFRILAEQENYKKRMDADLMKARKYAGFDLASKLIDSLEIFNQALNIETNDPNLQNFLVGFKMIDQMIFNALKEAGVSLIETKVGAEFDPTKQEAMDKDYDPEQPLHTVLKVVKKGYMFKDRILRPSTVIINIKPEEEQQTEQESKEKIEENQEGKDE